MMIQTLCRLAQNAAIQSLIRDVFMKKKLLIKVLAILEETYPEAYSISRITKKLNVSIDGEFSKVVRYLKAKRKVIAPERLQSDSRINITPEGIDFFLQNQLLESEQKRNEIMKWTMMVIAGATIVNLIIAFMPK